MISWLMNNNINLFLSLFALFKRRDSSEKIRKAEEICLHLIINILLIGGSYFH